MIVFLITVHASRHVRLAAVSRLIIHAGDGSHTDILLHEVFIAEVVEHLVVVHVSVVICASLRDAGEFLLYNVVHRVEASNEIARRLRELFVIGEGAELLVDAFGP